MSPNRGVGDEGLLVFKHLVTPLPPEAQRYTQTIPTPRAAPNATECEDSRENHLPHPLKQTEVPLPLQPLSPLTPESENMTQKEAFSWLGQPSASVLLGRGRRVEGRRLAIRNPSFTPMQRSKFWGFMTHFHLK